MPSTRPLAVFLGLCLVLGVLYRLHPILGGPEQLAQFFITEDGYLMLTVARNFAMGHGLSVSDATIATNGVQPLATFLFAIPYWITGGDKLSSLIGVIAIMTIWSVGTFWAIARFGQELFRPLGASPIWPWVMATLWFIGTKALLHSMNALETGLYIGCVALTVAVFGRICARGGAYTRRDQIVFGLLCGITFLARIDGALLIIALFVTRLIYMPASKQLSIAGAIREAILPGLITLAIALPWLVHNQIYFGSIMPISGTAQSMSASFGQNIPKVPPRIFETMFPMLPLPGAVERITAVIFITGGVVALVLTTFLWRILRARHPFAVAIFAYFAFALALVCYYGLYFGAPHFLSRYFAPLGPLLFGAAFYLVLDFSRNRRVLGLSIPASLSVMACILSLALLGRLLIPGVKDQGHFHVVGWVQEHIAPDTWVAAVQTGTLGYWHDRTVNLDGKVNPQALAARRQEGHVLNYVVDSDIDVIADWAGVGKWVGDRYPRFSEHFEVVVRDQKINLAILRRKSAGPGAGPRAGDAGS